MKWQEIPARGRFAIWRRKFQLRLGPRQSRPISTRVMEVKATDSKELPSVRSPKARRGQFREWNRQTTSARQPIPSKPGVFQNIQESSPRESWSIQGESRDYPLGLANSQRGR